MPMDPSGPVTGSPNSFDAGPRVGPASSLLAARLLLDVLPDGAPQVPVVTDLLLEVLHTHPGLERPLGPCVPSAVDLRCIEARPLQEPLHDPRDLGREIGRASCRERVYG